jgi:hypothetical protein
MKLELSFNHEVDDDTLSKLATTIKDYDEYTCYLVEINTISELKELVAKVNEIKKPQTSYNALIDFDDLPIIYFDNKS